MAREDVRTQIRTPGLAVTASPVNTVADPTATARRNLQNLSNALGTFGRNFDAMAEVRSQEMIREEENRAIADVIQGRVTAEEGQQPTFTDEQTAFYRTRAMAAWSTLKGQELSQRAVSEIETLKREDPDAFADMDVDAYVQDYVSRNMAGIQDETAIVNIASPLREVVARAAPQWKSEQQVIRKERADTTALQAASGLFRESSFTQDGLNDGLNALTQNGVALDKRIEWAMASASIAIQEGHSDAFKALVEPRPEFNGRSLYDLADPNQQKQIMRMARPEENEATARVVLQNFRANPENIDLFTKASAGDNSAAQALAQAAWETGDGRVLEDTVKRLGQLAQENPDLNMRSLVVKDEEGNRFPVASLVGSEALSITMDARRQAQKRIESEADKSRLEKRNALNNAMEAVKADPEMFSQQAQNYFGITDTSNEADIMTMLINRDLVSPGEDITNVPLYKTLTAGITGAREARMFAQAASNGRLASVPGGDKFNADLWQKAIQTNDPAQLVNAARMSAENGLKAPDFVRSYFSFATNGVAVTFNEASRPRVQAAIDLYRQIISTPGQSNADAADAYLGTLFDKDTLDALKRTVGGEAINQTPTTPESFIQDLQAYTETATLRLDPRDASLRERLGSALGLTNGNTELSTGWLTRNADVLNADTVDADVLIPALEHGINIARRQPGFSNLPPAKQREDILAAAMKKIVPIRIGGLLGGDVVLMPLESSLAEARFRNADIDKVVSSLTTNSAGATEALKEMLKNRPEAASALKKLEKYGDQSFRKGYFKIYARGSDVFLGLNENKEFSARTLPDVEVNLSEQLRYNEQLRRDAAINGKTEMFGQFDSQDFRFDWTEESLRKKREELGIQDTPVAPKKPTPVPVDTSSPVRFGNIVERSLQVLDAGDIHLAGALATEGYAPQGRSYDDNKRPAIGLGINIGGDSNSEKQTARDLVAAGIAPNEQIAQQKLDGLLRNTGEYRGFRMTAPQQEALFKVVNKRYIADARRSFDTLAGEGSFDALPEYQQAAITRLTYNTGPYSKKDKNWQSFERGFMKNKNFNEGVQALEIWFTPRGGSAQRNRKMENMIRAMSNGPEYLQTYLSKNK